MGTPVPAFLHDSVESSHKIKLSSKNIEIHGRINKDEDVIFK
jgi:hypothetical protein